MPYERLTHYESTASNHTAQTPRIREIWPFFNQKIQWDNLQSSSALSLASRARPSMNRSPRGRSSRSGRAALPSDSLATTSMCRLVRRLSRQQTPGTWTATDAGIGAGVDSYFEYLAKGALLFQRPELMRQFRGGREGEARTTCSEYQRAMDKFVRKEDWFMWVSMTKATVSLPIFQSLEAFWPGLLVCCFLSLLSFPQAMLGDVEDAQRILLQYSRTVRQFGFPPEFYNIPNQEVV